MAQTKAFCKAGSSDHKPTSGLSKGFSFPSWDALLSSFINQSRRIRINFHKL